MCRKIFILTRKLKKTSLGLFLVLLFAPLSQAVERAELDLVPFSLAINNKTATFRVPSGYKLELLNDKIDDARLFTFTEDGILFIGTNDDHVYKLPPPYTKPEVFAKLAGNPHSVAIRKITADASNKKNHGRHELWVATKTKLLRLNHDIDFLANVDGPLSHDDFITIASLPGGFGHSSRTVSVSPDNNIYVSLGISGNCSNEYLGMEFSFNDRRGGIMILDETTNELKPFASGLRNPVGYAWHPESGEIYASNNGPDHLGYHAPPEYFTIVTNNSYHGMPWFQFDGNTIFRDDCIDSAPPRPISDVNKPVATFLPRSAPMGVTFIKDTDSFGEFSGSAIVAIHGSWGTLPKGGFFGARHTRRPPAIKLVRFENGSAKSVSTLVSGFQQKSGKRWARPIGVGFGPDGNLYFTSDGGDAEGLFRLSKI